MALDQGTTSSRALVFGHNGEILGSAQEAFTQHYPQPGWVEHDPEEIWHTQLRSARLALEKSGLAASDIAALGITNQRETCLLWDAETGRSLGNAICWQCRRTADRCTELREAGLDVVVADPPRSGLGLPAARRLTSMAQRRTVLVACDPVSLARDLRPFVESGHALAQLELFDLFPGSHHLEAVALLERRG